MLHETSCYGIDKRRETTMQARDNDQGIGRPADAHPSARERERHDHVAHFPFRWY